MPPASGVRALQWGQDLSKRKTVSDLMHLLVVGPGDYAEIFPSSRDDEEMARKYGQPAAVVKITMAANLSSKIVTKVSEPVDYVLLVVDSTDPGCLDRLETECSYIGDLYFCRRRVEICVYQNSITKAHVWLKQFEAFLTRYQNPVCTAVYYDDPESTENFAKNLYRRLSFINRNPGYV